MSVYGFRLKASSSVAPCKVCSKAALMGSKQAANLRVVPTTCDANGGLARLWEYVQKRILWGEQLAEHGYSTA